MRYSLNQLVIFCEVHEVKVWNRCKLWWYYITNNDDKIYDFLVEIENYIG